MDAKGEAEHSLSELWLRCFRLWDLSVGTPV